MFKSCGEMRHVVGAGNVMSSNFLPGKATYRAHSVQKALESSNLQCFIEAIKRRAEQSPQKRVLWFSACAAHKLAE